MLTAMLGHNATTELTIATNRKPMNISVNKVNMLYLGTIALNKEISVKSGRDQTVSIRSKRSSGRIGKTASVTGSGREEPAAGRFQSSPYLPLMDAPQVTQSKT